MKFLLLDKPNEWDFSLVYRADEYSFDVEPYLGWSFTSLLVNTVQLEIDHEGRIGYVWGYCPLVTHTLTKEFPKCSQPHSLIAMLERPPVPGSGQRINQDEDWPIHINKKKGWVCIGDAKVCNKELIEFAPNCVASLVNRELKGLWLKPRELPDS